MNKTFSFSINDNIKWIYTINNSNIDTLIKFIGLDFNNPIKENINIKLSENDSTANGYYLADGSNNNNYSIIPFFITNRRTTINDIQITYPQFKQLYDLNNYCIDDITNAPNIIQEIFN